MNARSKLNKGKRVLCLSQKTNSERRTDGHEHCIKYCHVVSVLRHIDRRDATGPASRRPKFASFLLFGIKFCCPFILAHTKKVKGQLTVTHDMKTNIYLNFDGSCGEAFDFYKSIFGGEFHTRMTFADVPSAAAGTAWKVDPKHKSRIMHVSLPLGENMDLMGSDVIPTETSHKF